MRDLASVAPIAQDFGAVIEAAPGEALADLGREAAALLRLLDTSGAVLLRGFPLNPSWFSGFVDALTARRLTYGGPREKVSDNDEVQLVEPGSGTFGLHCELSATPFRPDLCFFGCERPANRDGETTLADGVRVLAAVSDQTRALFRSRRVKYTWRYDAARWKRMFRIDSAEELHAILDGRPGLTYELRDDGSLSSEFVTDAIVTRSSAPSSPAFANSLMTVAGPRPGQPFHSTFEDGSLIPDEVREEIRAAAAALTVPIAWRPHDVLIIDNWRVLHGRRAFDDPGRRILAMFGDRA
ncbi:TauD/TfdA family dioxygenase [Hyalangium versicolor]|uniref:TauD/TfdA family dioxygenase n=1 Tax=Hyalangium versicolor TaxID=2861190 RepID=UPI001CCB0EDD|nr:TauD/TfdA family dioxygenase [Hyalangium versicolor]